MTHTLAACLTLAAVAGGAWVALSRAPQLLRTDHPVHLPAYGAPAVAAAALLGALSGLQLPGHVWPAWLVLSTFGAIAVGVDEAAEQLPTRLLAGAWVLILVLLVVQAVAEPAGMLPHGMRLAAGVAVGAGAYAIAWRVGGLGFGDVRLAGLVGGVCALAGLDLMWQALLAGTLLGVARMLVVGVVRGRLQPLPHGAAILAGAWAAAAAHALI